MLICLVYVCMQQQHAFAEGRSGVLDCRVGIPVYIYMYVHRYVYPLSIRLLSCEICSSLAPSNPHLVKLYLATRDLLFRAQCVGQCCTCCVLLMACQPLVSVTRFAIRRGAKLNMKNLAGGDTRCSYTSN